MGKRKAGKGQEEALQFPQDAALPRRLHELAGSGSKTCSNLSFSYFFFFKKEELKRIAPFCPLDIFPIILGTDTV